MRMRALIFALLAACSGPSACGHTPRERPAPVAPTPRPGYVGEDAKIPRREVVFPTPEEAARYDTLRACLVRDEPGWFHYPLRGIGAFIQEEWCIGHGAGIHCEGGDTRSAPPAGWTMIEVMRTHGTNEVYGLAFSVGELPPDGLGTSVSWSKDGRPILGEHFWLRFSRVVGGDVKQTLSLGMHDELEVGLHPIRVTAEGSQTELWHRVRASPDALLAEIVARMDALEAAVTKALDEDLPRKCIYGEYGGDGVPPPCVKEVPLDAAEKAAARTKLTDYVTSSRAWARDEAPAMHAAFVELVPDRCFSP